MSHFNQAEYFCGTGHSHKACWTKLKCPAQKMLIVESGGFIPANGNYNPVITYNNCSSQTKHSKTAKGKVINHNRREDKDICQALNRRCSGYSNSEECKFSLLLNQPESRSWGEGWVDILHKCVDQTNINTKCGRVRTVERGYIMSKAYP